MALTTEQVAEVLTKISLLDPALAMNYTEEQIVTYIGIADTIIVSSGIEIPDNNLILAIAVKTLSLLSLPENTSLSKKKIKDVEIVYFQGQGKSKWDTLFDSIISGATTDDKALYYVGI